MEQLITNFGKYNLERLPRNNSLRAWDAADELLIRTVYDQYPAILDNCLIINDSFGALAVALNQHGVSCWSDSFISQLATKQNIELNNLEGLPKLIAATDELEQTYKLVIIKIPKTLSLLEDQLCRLKPHVDENTKIIAAAMSKHIHNSTLQLFEKILGPTTTSRATKKARLVFTNNDISLNIKSPYPKIVEDQAIGLKLYNYANVFANERLDMGTRFFIDNLEKCPQAKHIIDLGCGNGALGIIAKRLQPEVGVSFVDESYAAIKSARENYSIENPEDQAHFYISNALAQYNGEKADLILCNPPFHQSHGIGDQIAWEMFIQSRDALEINGELWIVGNRHLGYHIKLKKVFGNCRTIAANKKFVILAANKADRLLRRETNNRK